VEATNYYHDLQCRSGLGDRFLDLWAALTVARLHDPASRLFVCWHPGRRFSSFVGDYATAGFSVRGCVLLEGVPSGTIAMPAEFSHSVLNLVGIVELPCGARQIILRRGMVWGNTPPDRLHEDLPFYGLDPTIPLQRVVDAYRDAAFGTEHAPPLEAAQPAGLAGRIGVHVRLGDKLVAQETSHDMSEATWRGIERDALGYLERCIAAGWGSFVCGDDPGYTAALAGRLRARGGDVVMSDPGRMPGALVGAAGLLDLFALARCALIVQMTKYSTFSMAASLIGDVPLVNFFRGPGGGGHRLDLWRSAIRLVPLA
jgi:hypothetical protein